MVEEGGGFNGQGAAGGTVLGVKISINITLFYSCLFVLSFTINCFLFTLITHGYY